MHDPTPKATRHRWRRLLPLGLLLLLGLWWGLRTEVVAGALLRQRLGTGAGIAALGHVGPAGWAGLRVDDVVLVERSVGGWWPRGSMERVEVHPDMGASIRAGRLRWRVHIAGARLHMMAPRSPGGRPAPGAADPGRRPVPLNALSRVSWTGGEVVLEDPAAAVPDVVTRLERVDVERQGSGWALQGRLETRGLGRALVRGSWEPGARPRAVVRMLEDQDMQAWWGDGQGWDADSSLSLGALELAWPPEVTVRPASVRRLHMGLPGLPSWRLENVWAEAVTLRLMEEGWRLEARDVRLRLVGLLRASDIRISALMATRRVEEGLWTLQMDVVDGEGRALTVDLARHAGRLEFAARSAGMDAGSLTPLGTWTHHLVVSGGEVRGEVTGVWLDAVGRWEVAVHGGVSSLRTSALWLADEPVTWPMVELRGGGWWEPGTGAIEVGPLAGRLGALSWQGSATRDAAGDLAAEVAWAEVEVSSLVASLPETLRGELASLGWRGALAGEAAVEVRWSDALATTLSVEVRGTGEPGVEVWSPAVPLDRWMDPAFVWEVERRGLEVAVGPAASGWTPLERLPEHVWRAVLAAEDDGFWRHRGFDVRGLQAALQANVEARALVRGGSTISQQVVKNLFLPHDRSLARKVQEALLTMAMESSAAKRAILEWYLNLVEWGEGVVGIEAAARRYFSHGAAELTLRESLLLAAILPNPVRYGGQYLRGELEESRRVKMRNILVNMHRSGVVDDRTLEDMGRLVLQGQVSASPPRRATAGEAGPGPQVAVP